MLEAHFSGKLQLSEVDTHDPLWWKRFRLVASFIDNEKQHKIAEKKLDIGIAEYLSTTIDEDDISAITGSKQTTEYAFNDYAKSLRPWGTYGPRGTQELVEKMRDRYISRFGDPSTEEGKKAVDNTIRLLKERKKATKRRKRSK